MVGGYQIVHISLVNRGIPVTDVVQKSKEAYKQLLNASRTGKPVVIDTIVLDDKNHEQRIIAPLSSRLEELPNFSYFTGIANTYNISIRLGEASAVVKINKLE